MNKESDKKDIDEDKSRKALFVQRLCAFIRGTIVFITDWKVFATMTE